jgi:hypothetical protein
MFDNNVHDILDDRIDTVTRGLLGLTVSCARCHDHKYDPIPMADYYALYGVFASSEAPLELPLLEPLDGRPMYAEFEKKAAPKRQELKKFLDSQYALLLETARQRVGDYLVHVVTTPPDPLESAIYFLSLAPEDLRPPIVARWRVYVEQHARPDDPVFGPWHDLMRLADADLSRQAGAVLEAWRSRPAGVERGQVNPLVRAALEKAKLASRADVARAYGNLLREVYEASKKAPPEATAVSSGATADSVTETRARQQLLAIVIDPDSPAYFPKDRTRDYMSRGEKDGFGGKLQELDRLAVQAAAAPPRAMALVDAEQPYEPRVFVRGNPSRPGAKVPRQFVGVATKDLRPFGAGSGRLDLARAITAADNPLTARVFVNRVWMHHFGEPLVESPSDFGLRTMKPPHAELLDWLAVTFVQEGWSLKKLHRLLVLSSTYRQAGYDRPECRQVDPDNRLLWRANRRRLDLEAMRDSLLAISGRIDRRMFGRPVNVAGEAVNRRRTVYGLVDRQSLPGLFRAFDFASPDQSAERRPQTTVPQQALFGLNGPFVIEQARALVARSEVAGEAVPERRVAALYRLVLGRPPSDEEARLACGFVAGQNSKSAAFGPWQQLAQVLLLTNESAFLE